MAIQFTSNTINFDTQSNFKISSIEYPLTTTSFPFAPTASPNSGSALTFIPQRDFFSYRSVGSDGYAFYLYSSESPNDDFAVIDRLLFPQLTNAVVKFRLDIGAQLFDLNSGALAGRTAGSIWCLARWGSSGTLTVTNTRRLFYNTTFLDAIEGTIEDRISVETTNTSGNACLPIAIGNALYLRFRKSNITHDTRYSTDTNIYLYGLSTFERYAFFYPTSSTVGHGNGVYN